MSSIPADVSTVVAAGQAEGAPRQARWPALLAAVALAALVAGVFWPTVNFEFVDFDTNSHIVNNPHIRGLTLENLTYILTTRCVTSYYPVRTLSYALDYQLWGLRPGGFKLTNGLIHLANVLLVFWLARRLLRTASAESPASARELLSATFSAALFAVHPVVVEPVAWVPGREELLMTLGALGCIHFQLTARRLDGSRDRALRRRVCYTGAAVCCAAACLSNAVGAVIPLLVTAWDALALPRPKLRRLLCGTSALWLIAAATVLIKGWHIPPDAISTVPRVFSYEWLLMIPSVYWLNLKTLVWPMELGILYEWIPSFGFRQSEILLGSIAIAATPLLYWKLRRRTLILFGLLWFLLALAPTSQIMPHHIARADRFLYLPIVGLAIAASAAGVALDRVLRRPTAAVAVVLGLMVLTAAASLSAAQLRTWQNSYTMWENCLRVSPQNPMAHRCFAEILANRGRFGEAIPHYHMALRVEPDSVPTLHSFAMRLATCEDELRDCPLAIRLARRGCELTKWQDPEIRRALAMAHTSSAVSQHSRGEYGLAIDDLRCAIEADPAYEVALFNLAMLLATCSDEALRQPDEAVTLATRGCEQGGQPDAFRLKILAAAHAAAGQRAAAVAAFRRAIASARAAGDTTMTAELLQQLARYEQDAAAR